MAFVKEGKIEKGINGYTLTYINHRRHPRGLMMRELVTLQVHEESLTLVEQFVNKRVRFEIKENKAIIQENG